MIIWVQWWFWIVAGIALGVLELVAPAFILLGFSIGALAVGILLALGMLGTSLPPIILVFAVVSLIAWIALRKIFGLRHGQVKIWKNDINDH